MTDVQQRASAKEFAAYWKNRGDEKQETQRFWIDLLRNVYGVPNPEQSIEFEVPVKLSHTSFIDAERKGHSGFSAFPGRWGLCTASTAHHTAHPPIHRLAGKLPFPF